jgi:hypothetical protein
MLDTSWPGVFREFLLEELPVERIASCFHERKGRPTKELYTMLGGLILQQMLDLTDEGTVEALAFDTRWHYALDIVLESDADKYVSERTLRGYRRKVTELGLDAVLFSTLTDKLLRAFGVPTDRQRLDSTHICSNMRALRRLELFATVVEKFLKNLKRQEPELYAERVDKGLVNRYDSGGMKQFFGQVKPREAWRKLEEVAQDLLVLVETFKGHKRVCRKNSYKAMGRVLSEQCEVVQDEEQTRVVVKEPKEVVSDSLQNPSDPNAAYDSHKGPGYQSQIAETYQATGADEKKDETKPDLITHVRVEPANQSDAHALLPAIEDTKQRGCAPEELVADTAYGSDENVEKAKGENVEVIAPAPATKTGEDRMTRDKFRLTENECTCPEGQTSRNVQNKENDRVVVEFDRERCLSCPRREKCQITITRQRAYLKFEPKQARLAKRRTENDSDAFREKYRWRAGIEGTMSRYKAETGAGRLRVRGLSAVRFAATLKALGMNILRSGRALAALFARISATIELPAALWGLLRAARPIRFRRTRFSNSTRMENPLSLRAAA